MQFGIQSRFRGAGKSRTVSARREAASISIQAAWRGYIVRQNISCLQANVVRSVHSSILAGRTVRKSRAAENAAACSIQSRFRGGKSRNPQSARRKAASTCIQAAWRGCTVRKSRAAENAAACSIQSRFRGGKSRTVSSTKSGVYLHPSGMAGLHGAQK